MNRARRRPARRAGFVLVIALTALAVMTLLLLALLQGASHQVRGAESDANVAREKMLAETAVAQVMGQIQLASSQPGQTWISQPGLLRTYTGTSRQPAKSYRLYSAATPTDSSGGLAFLATDIPTDWNSAANQNLYVDLNASQQAPGSGALIYPILDPGAFTAVEGVSSDNGTVEMPVMWLYQLQDGTLGPAANATKANPIVGRIAYWTDDESCKININTAGCGLPWNTPRVNSTDDVAWSTMPPALGEFSRYPGHPAMTSLAPVFSFGSQGLFTTGLSPQQLLALTPRYAWGGSQWGAQTTILGEAIPLKNDRLYASLDELCFGSAVTPTGQRVANPITPAQLDQARFVLTAHSVSPETNLLGEPRIAIWPVADDSTDDTKTTATDRAVESAATVGPVPVIPTATTRKYFFQRHDALSATSDLDTTQPWGASNMQLFNELLGRSYESLPGCSVTFQKKYPTTQWTQLMLEITDFIRGLNAIDPSPAPFVPYAATDPKTSTGRGFVTPLTLTDPASQTTLRGLGRCPTLSSLTLVFYVCGFGLNDGKKNASTIDFEANPDDITGKTWTANFDPNSSTNVLAQVTSELVRAFVVPVTFHPGCAFPEVSDACKIQIQGLNGLGVSSANPAGFGFPSTATSQLIGTPLEILAPDRAWGGNEGPLIWRGVGDALANHDPSSASVYPFAGSQAIRISCTPSYNSTTKKMNWSVTQSLSFPSAVQLTVLILDTNGNTLQTLKPQFPKGPVFPAPTFEYEADHYDMPTPGAAVANWSSNSGMQVKPSYYMNMENRLLATQGNRPFMVQPGDTTRSVEAGTDLRVIASLATVPSTDFQVVGSYTSQYLGQIHNIRFADGTSAYGAYDSAAYGTYQLPAPSPLPSPSSPTSLVYGAAYAHATVAVIPTGADWNTGQSTPLANAWFTSVACSAPTGASYVSMAAGLNGDWDTGPGFCADGAQINLPDAGTSLDPSAAYFSLAGRPASSTPNFSATRFSPNALVSSPVIFGSLPAGINPAGTSQPWRTLLFCPYPAADAGHPGFASPPDYLVLDNFWMPTVEPYALSTCMATSGKINLNDQIAPFTYLHRNTAFHALLSDLRIPAIPLIQPNPYKTSGTPATSIWMPIDETATIQAWEAHDVYLTEGEICAMPIVPKGIALANLDTFWNGGQPGGGRMTGDNLRELPYAQLYGRLTTRSNSYTVHVRVQVLQKLPGDPQQNVWKEGTDLVLGDWRGSYEIERDFDPTISAPAAATPATPGVPLGPYHFRVVSSRRFSP